MLPAALRHARSSPVGERAFALWLGVTACSPKILD